MNFGNVRTIFDMTIFVASNTLTFPSQGFFAEIFFSVAKMDV